ncbi:MAG TPA: saccharopine dehydrogenase NADP-binding domain-containing protein, partial [Phycisphaerae bacterium]|nr:saccharopine dehydrogenase NADP-binding domain-containing protein [Phycisphaerae bacterium]
MTTTPALNRLAARKAHKLNFRAMDSVRQRGPAPWSHRRRRPNLLVLGASGHVAGAFLRRLSGRRDLFNDLVLLDRDEHVLENRYLDHSRLRYTFVRQDLRIGENAADYVRLLRQYQIDIVLDLTDMDTLPVFQATDAAGVSYINTALNDARAGVHQMVAAIHPTRHRPRRAPHIISSGMNPGAVNIWVMHGVRNFGVPREIIHF